MNPKIDPLPEVEVFLIAGDGLWSLVVPSLRESLLDNQAGDERFPEDIQATIRTERERANTKRLYVSSRNAIWQYDVDLLLLARTPARLRFPHG